MKLFTYGIFARTSVMLDFAPTAVDLGSHALKDHVRIYVGGLANIVATKGGIVLGVLWEIDEKDLPRFDNVEDYPNSYNRKKVSVAGKDAVVYFMTEQFLDFLTPTEKGGQ